MNLNFWISQTTYSMLTKPVSNVTKVEEKSFVKKEVNESTYWQTTTKNKCLLCCLNANGLVLPLYVVYKAKHLCNTWTKNGPENCHYNTSPSGWMEAEQFTEWFEKIFVKYTLHITGPKLLIFDGHDSHVSLDVILKAKLNNITLYVYQNTLLKFSNLWMLQCINQWNQFGNQF